MARKRRNGFEGERLINLPEKVCKKLARTDSTVFPIYVTEIGYFPRASFHYRERRKGCVDNILIYCLQGRGHYILGSSRYEVTANQYILIPATTIYMRYWADIQDPWTIYWVHFTGSGLPAINRFLDLDNHKGPVSVPFNRQGIEFWNHIYRSLDAGFNRDNLCNANFYLYTFLATFLFPGFSEGAPKADHTDTLSNMIEYMRSNMAAKITIESLAYKAKISPSYLTKLFRKSTGMAPISYLIHLKMQKACQLLYNEDIKVKAIALQLGYDDPYYFSRLFKRSMGTSPERYRSVNRKSSSNLSSDSAGNFYIS